MSRAQGSFSLPDTSDIRFFEADKLRIVTLGKAEKSLQREQSGLLPPLPRSQRMDFYMAFAFSFPFCQNTNMAILHKLFRLLGISDQIEIVVKSKRFCRSTLMTD